MRTFGSWQALCRLAAAASLAACALALTTTGAQAASASAAPGWEVTPMTYPSPLKPGGEGYIVLPIYNVGKAPSSGHFTVTDVLPEGVTATEAGYAYSEGSLWNCSIGSVVACTNINSTLPSVNPGSAARLAIAVDVSPDASGPALNQVTVSGGGALSSASVSESLTIDLTPASFGFQSLDGWFANADGTLDTQAGSHPYDLTVALALNNSGYEPAGEPRDITVNLPRGLIGNTTAVPRCTSALLNTAECPADSEVGVDTATLSGAEPLAHPEGERRTIDEYGTDFLFDINFPVYNMVPPPGVPVQLAFSYQCAIKTGDIGLVSTVAVWLLRFQFQRAPLRVWMSCWRTARACRLVSMLG